MWVQECRLTFRRVRNKVLLRGCELPAKNGARAASRHVGLQIKNLVYQLLLIIFEVLVNVELTTIIRLFIIFFLI